MLPSISKSTRIHNRGLFDEQQKNMALRAEFEKADFQEKLTIFVSITERSLPRKYRPSTRPSNNFYP